MVAEPQSPAPSPPPDPAAIPRLKPLAPEEARRLNAFLFTHHQDHTAAAAAFHTTEVELMLFLDQPHITPYLQRFAANRRDQRTDRAAAKLDELISRTTNDIELRRAITTLFRFYQPPRATRSRTIRTGPDNPPPPPALDPDPDGFDPRSHTTDQPQSSRAIRIGAEDPRPHQAPDADPDGLDVASPTNTKPATSRAIGIGAKSPRPHPAPNADPDGSGAPGAAAPGATSSHSASSDNASTTGATVQTSASPTRDHSTTRPRDHSPEPIIDDLTPLMPTDPDELTVWISRVSAKRYRWTKADQRAFRADIKAAREAAHAHARERGIDLSTSPLAAAGYIAGFITRLCDEKPTPNRPP